VNSTAVIWQRNVVPVKKINKGYKVMLQNIKQLYGDKLAALDGDIGHVKDFYFDDESWVIRYLVADTGSWLTGRLVLLTPHAFGKLDQSEKTFHIKLHKKQIEDSPSIESHKPVSRQFEVEYYSYYGWPPYWDGGGMSGIGPIPVALPLLVDRIKSHQKHKHREDKHLRSTQAISGYHIQTSDGEIGHITDFIIDEKSWTIRDLVIETGHWYSGKEILIPSSKVKQISYEETKVFVSLTKKDIQRTAENEISVHSR
jgi:sporulation protein YlmC with PRC-barrel domain